MRRFIVSLALAFAAVCSFGQAALAGSVAANIQTTIQGRYSATSELGSLGEDINRNLITQYSAGTGTGQADLFWQDQRTLAASATETLDLTGLTDNLGAAMACGHLKELVIEAASGNTNDVILGNAGSNPFTGPLAGTTPTFTAKPGSVTRWSNGAAAGWVVDSTHKNVKLANSAGTTGVTYNITVICTST